MPIGLTPKAARAMMPLISVETMALAVFPHLIPEPRFIIVIEAYLDDSGTHDGSAVIVVAGFLGSVDEWLKIVPEWQKRLKLDGLHRFRMTDCVAGRAPFDGLSEPRRNLLIDDLCSLIGARDLLGISAAMLRADWDAVVAAEFPDILDVLDSPYYALSSSCIQQAVKHTSDRFDGKESLAIVYDCRPQDSPKQLALPGLYKAHTYWGQSIVAMTPGLSAQFIPLQAADLFANELYRNHVGRHNNPEAFTAHPRLVKLMRNVPLEGNFMNRDALRRQSARFRDLKRSVAEVEHTGVSHDD